MSRPVAIPEGAVQAAAFTLVRREGLTALTARRVAEAVGCSTQPVYSACGSMEALRAEVLARGHAFVASALRTGDPGDPPLLRLGLATLRLAHDEPNLYQLAVTAMQARATEPPAEVLRAMRADPCLAALPKAKLVELHTLLWVVTQGLVLHMQAHPGPTALAQAGRLLRRAGAALVAHAALP